MLDFKREHTKLYSVKDRRIEITGFLSTALGVLSKDLINPIQTSKNQSLLKD